MFVTLKTENELLRPELKFELLNPMMSAVVMKIKISFLHQFGIVMSAVLETTLTTLYMR